MSGFMTRFQLFILTFIVSFAWYGSYTQAAEPPKAFVPTGAWLVGPSSLVQAADSGKPCMMMNEYNSGFVIRFSGGNEIIHAMAIDFQKDLFTKGKRYDIDLALSSGLEKSLASLAIDDTTVLISLESVSGFYDKLAASKFMAITMDGIPLDFAMLGIADGLARLAQCYNPVKSKNNEIYVPQQARAGNQNSISAAEISPAYASKLGKTPEPIPGMTTTSFDKNKAQANDKIKKEAVAEKDKIVARKQEEASVAATPRRQKPEVSPSALPAEQDSAVTGQMAVLDNMMARASKAIAALEPAAGGRPKGMSHESTAPVAQTQQAAVQSTSIGRPLASTWLSPATKPAGMTNQHVATAPPQPVAENSVPERSTIYEANRQRRWRAIRGTNLREVLDVWSRNAHVKLQWAAEEDFALQESIRMEGTFEQAVSAVLSQHNNESRRPVGRIYIDPGLGQKVLLVEGL